MGRSRYSGKTEADNVKKIETSFLKKHDYFRNDSRSGTITWATHFGDKSSVGIEVSTSGDEKYLRIHYMQTDRDTGEKTDFDYKIPLTTTPCRFGGVRYWYICPMSRSGVYCGKRVGVLYKDGDYFACRHCYDLTYASKKLSGRMKAFGRIISFPEIDEARAKVKREYYNGKPTRKYSRYLEKNRKAWVSFGASVQLLQNRELTKRKNDV